jgi:hypothetical protein
VDVIVVEGVGVKVGRIEVWVKVREGVKVGGIRVGVSNGLKQDMRKRVSSMNMFMSLRME